MLRSIKLQSIPLTDFINRKKVGVILRVFAAQERDIPKRVEMIKGFIEQAQAITILGKPVFRQIDVLVWADQEYDLKDCGQTAAAMRKALHGYKQVRVHEIEHGDLFCATLNFGIGIQSRAGVDYSMIASAEARTYLNQVTIERMIQALCDGARATGVAINELTPSILEGRLANTFAIWHNISLQTVGLFDLTADMPHDLRFADFKRGWHEKVGVVHYHTAGVEEVIPLARMVVIFGACIAPVLPCQDDGQEVHYEEPDPATQPELYQRHVSKMGTKLERQTAHLAQVKCDITYLKGGVMKKYRRF